MAVIMNFSSCHRAWSGRAGGGRLMTRGVGWLAVTGWWFLGGLGAAVGAEGGPAGAAMEVLRTQCLSCHNEEKQKGGLSLASREALLRGGDEGAVVVEGDPEGSPLLQLLAAEADPHMPPKKQLSAGQIGVVAEWLRAGAPWDAAVLAGGAGAGDPVLRAVALAPLPSGYRPVMALALSPDGKRLAAGCGHELAIFDLADGGMVLRARASGHFDPVQSVGWSPDGERLVTGAFRRVMIWKAGSLTPEREVLSGLSDRITALQVLPGGREVVLADGLTAEKGVIRVLELGSGRVVRSWPAHDDTIFAMALSGDGRVLATAGGDRLVRFWEVATGGEAGQLEAHATQVLGLALNGEGTQLVTAGADQELKVWDVATRENTVALATKLSAFTAVAWQAQGAVFAVTEEGGLWRYTDLKAHTGAQSSDTGSESQLGRAESALYSLVVTPDGERIFAGSSDGRVMSWDKEGKLLQTIDPAAVPVVAATPTLSTP